MHVLLWNKYMDVERFFFFFNFAYLVFVHGRALARSEDGFEGLFLSFHLYIGSWDHTLVAMLVASGFPSPAISKALAWYVGSFIVK